MLFNYIHTYIYICMYKHTHIHTYILNITVIKKYKLKVELWKAIKARQDFDTQTTDRTHSAKWQPSRLERPQSRGREAKLLRGTLQFQTRKQRLSCNLRHLKPTVQRSMQRILNAPSTRNLKPYTYSSQMPSKLLAHEMNKRWSWWEHWQTM